MIKCLNIKVKGQVQGVCFRFYAQKKARELGIFGIVRNEKDNTVMIEAEGEEEKLQEFLNWCAVGPEYAQVEKVEQSEEKQKNYKDFKIEY